MKHLRKFNESGQMIDTNNLSDILEDIIELGHTCHVQSDWWSDRGCSIDIVIYGDRERICTGRGNSSIGYIYVPDFLPTLQRLVSYLETEDYFPDENTSKRIKIIEESLTWKDPLIGISERAINRGFFTKPKDEKSVSISNMSEITFRWDSELKTWLIHGSPDFYFTERS
jgi:hypothetical protein